MRSIGRIAAATMVALAMQAQALDIECQKRDEQAPMSLICDYAILKNQYETIFAEQNEMLNSGKLLQADIDTWRVKRDACASVTCMDEVFAQWRQTKATLDKAPPPHESMDGAQPTVTPNLPEQAPSTKEAPHMQPAAQEAAAGTHAVDQEASLASPATQPQDAASTVERITFACRVIAVIVMLIGIFAFVDTRKVDRRFKTGFKDNEPDQTNPVFGFKMLMASAALFALAYGLARIGGQ